MSGVRYKSFYSSSEAQAWLKAVEPASTMDDADAERKCRSSPGQQLRQVRLTLVLQFLWDFVLASQTD